MNFVLTTAIGETLELAMLDQAYFLQEVGSRPLEEQPDQPGFYRCECLSDDPNALVRPMAAVPKAHGDRVVSAGPVDIDEGGSDAPVGSDHD